MTKDLLSEVANIRHYLSWQGHKKDAEALGWVIEQVKRLQKLENTCSQQLYKQNKRYQKTLEFYADKSTYDIEHLDKYGYVIIDMDGGKKARKTLEGSKCLKQLAKRQCGSHLYKTCRC